MEGIHLILKSYIECSTGGLVEVSEKIDLTIKRKKSEFHTRKSMEMIKLPTINYEFALAKGKISHLAIHNSFRSSKNDNPCTNQ